MKLKRPKPKQYMPESILKELEKSAKKGKNYNPKKELKDFFYKKKKSKREIELEKIQKAIWRK